MKRIIQSSFGNRPVFRYKSSPPTADCGLFATTGASRQRRSHRLTLYSAKAKHHCVLSAPFAKSYNRVGLFLFNLIIVFGRCYLIL